MRTFRKARTGRLRSNALDHMDRSSVLHRFGPCITLLVLLAACGNQVGSTAPADAAMGLGDDGAAEQVDQQVGRGAGSDTSQISEYVRRIFQDSRGHLWFGTNTDGVCRYDGEGFTCFSTDQGLPGTQVTGILEDRNGNMWFSIRGGMSRYDGRSITTYTTKDGLGGEHVACLLEDRDGVIWAGTAAGAFRFNGSTFTAFPIPVFDVLKPDSAIELKYIAAMLQDAQGNMWFGSRGEGVCKYDPSDKASADGKTFTRLTTADGLCDNEVVCIVQDKQGNMWFSTMNGGLSRYDGHRFTNHGTANRAIGNDEVWTMHVDGRGDLWCASEGYGVYRHDPLAANKAGGPTFTNYGEKEGLGVGAAQAIMEDTKGRMWVGGAGGLYRLEGDAFINVRRNGPWPTL